MKNEKKDISEECRSILSYDIYGSLKKKISNIKIDICVSVFIQKSENNKILLTIVKAMFLQFHCTIIGEHTEGRIMFKSILI